MQQPKNSNDPQRIKIQVLLPHSALPLCCPLPSMTLWNMHPRVYLAPDEDGHAMCPYCSTHYIVSDE